MVRYAWRCRRVLRASRFDAIYFNQWPYLHILLAGRYARQRAGIDWCEARNGAIHRLPQRILPKFVRLNLAVNQWTADVLTLRSGIQVGYLPSGVDSAHFTSSETQRSGLLFLGRLVENKNLPLLIAGFAEYRARGGQETLVVAGSGPEDRAMRANIAGLDTSVAAAIQVLGEVSDETKRTLLATKRLLVIPSRREGFPNAIVEALASGMPTVTVASLENGAAHVVEQYRIGTVGEPTAVSLAVAIDEALANWTPLSRRCLDLSPQFDWSVLADQLSTALSGATQGSTR
jgi:glycosyltransferase involved in cell wall biosynthesis